MNHTLLGVLGAVFLIFLVVLHSGSGADRFLDPYSISIVFGGILVAALISFRRTQLKAMLHGLRLIFNDDPTIDSEVKQLVKFASDHARKDLRAAEQTISQTVSPFLKLGFQLVTDNTPIDDMMRILEWRIRQMKEEETSTARCFKNLSSASPAFGMLGTLAGLIGMLGGLKDANIGNISSSMALALTATAYGVIMAYLIFKPIASKLEQRTARRVFMLHVLMDGLILVRVGRGPAMVEDSLTHLLTENRDEVRGMD